MEEKKDFGEPKKKDWETYRESLVNHLLQVNIDKENFEALLKIVDIKLETFKDDVDKIVEEVIKDA